MLIDRLTEEILLVFFLSSYSLYQASLFLEKGTVIIKCVNTELFGDALATTQLGEISTAIL